MKYYFITMIVLSLSSQSLIAQAITQWRGPDRNGVFPETGLLKSWPEEGPALLWSVDNLDEGYASVSVSGNRIYLTGRQDSTEYLTVLDTRGKRIWREAFGRGVRQSYPEARCTPTVEENRIYLISGGGEVVCMDDKTGDVIWSVPAFDRFRGEHWKWGIAESPLLVDNTVIYTPGGSVTTMVALDKFTGQTVWQTESLNEPSAYVSPVLIRQGNRKLIVQVLTTHIVGVDARDGNILWKIKYADIQSEETPTRRPENNCITPLYHDGQLYVTSGYDHVGVMFRLMNGGTEIKQLWMNQDLDCHHGQVVRVGNYIYGANWLNNSRGNWCCVDWTTGQTMYETEWHNKGSVSAADGMLYCYEEKKGYLALVEPTPDAFKVVSSFRITPGSGPHWTQPVIHNGVLYIRHGEALMAFDIKK